MASFTMPSLGADMEEGTLLEWLVKPGDTVKKGDIVAVVDTAKAAIEVETFLGGVVAELLVEPGTIVPVGGPLATIATGEAAPSAPPAPPPSTAPAADDSVTAAAAPEPVAQVHSPLVRKMAREQGVDLTQVRGTGPGGAITRDDVVAAAAPSAAPEAPAGDGAPTQTVRATPYARKLAAELGVDLAGLRHSDGTPVTADDVRAIPGRAVVDPAVTQSTVAEPAEPVVPAAPRQDRMRAAIAVLMARSKREIPHYYLSTTVDMSQAIGWMRDRNRTLSISERLVPAALLLKATALAATDVPELNGYWVDDGFQPVAEVNLGMAVSLRGGGLVTPALLDVGALGLGEVMSRMKDLVTRARGGHLRGRELTEGTLTVTNLGDQGVEAVYGVIYPPQVALVGFGRIAERPWAVDGLLGVRPLTTLTLSADHRASDAMTGARFLARIDDHLQHPEEL